VSASPARLASLDAFRGFTIAAMVLVNNPGDWSNLYRQLEHAEWNGWTFTDWIFPFFLFIGGVSMALSLGRLAEAGAHKPALLSEFDRSGNLVAQHPRCAFDDPTHLGFVLDERQCQRSQANILGKLRRRKKPARYIRQRQRRVMSIAFCKRIDDAIERAHRFLEGCRKKCLLGGEMLIKRGL